MAIITECKNKMNKLRFLALIISKRNLLNWCPVNSYLVLCEGCSYRNSLVNSLMAQHTCLHSSALKRRRQTNINTKQFDMFSRLFPLFFGVKDFVAMVTDSNSLCGTVQFCHVCPSCDSFSIYRWHSLFNAIVYYSTVKTAAQTLNLFVSPGFIF